MIDAQICTTACVHKVMILISLQYIRQYGSINLDGVTRQFLFSRYRRSNAKSFFSTLAGGKGLHALCQSVAVTLRPIIVSTLNEESGASLKQFLKQGCHSS